MLQKVCLNFYFFFRKKPVKSTLIFHICYVTHLYCHLKSLYIFSTLWIFRLATLRDMPLWSLNQKLWRKWWQTAWIITSCSTVCSSVSISHNTRISWVLAGVCGRSGKDFPFGSYPIYKMRSWGFQCDVPHQWIAQRHVGPVTVYCDGLGYSTVSTAWYSCVAAHWSKYHCYKQVPSWYDLRC